MTAPGPDAAAWPHAVTGTGAEDGPRAPDAASPAVRPDGDGPAPPPSPSPSPAEDVSTLDALRSDGAERFDAIRFAYLQALSRRTAAAEGELQALLHRKLQAASAELGQRMAQARQAAHDELAQVPPTTPDRARALRQLLKAGDPAGLRQLAAAPAPRHSAALLADLNRYIDRATQASEEGDADGLGALQGHGGQGGSGQPASAARIEMKSVRRFREVWSRIAAVDQADRAIGRAPGNAGPLNSHMLVLRSLALMRELSPDYLRRFMSHVDTLLWLEAQSQRPVVVEAKPARSGKGMATIKTGKAVRARK